MKRNSIRPKSQGGRIEQGRLRAYAAAREELLFRIASNLEKDERITAAWLAGSYGRGEQDAVSDIDIYVVVVDRCRDSLCGYDRKLASGAPVGRMDLFRQFGEPANIHENHHNAPVGGSFSAVLYRDPPVIVDWTFVPRSLAYRPEPTRLLFDRVGITSTPIITSDEAEIMPDPLDMSDPERIKERLAFFWMMSAVAAKYIVRGESAEIDWVLTFLSQVVEEIERLGKTQPLQKSEVYRCGDQEAGSRLSELMDRVEALVGTAVEPRSQVETIMNLRVSPGSPP